MGHFYILEVSIDCEDGLSEMNFLPTPFKRINIYDLITDFEIRFEQAVNTYEGYDVDQFNSSYCQQDPYTLQGFYLWDCVNSDHQLQFHYIGDSAPTYTVHDAIIKTVYGNMVRVAILVEFSTPVYPDPFDQDDWYHIMVISNGNNYPLRSHMFMHLNDPKSDWNNLINVYSKMNKITG